MQRDNEGTSVRVALRPGQTARLLATISGVLVAISLVVKAIHSPIVEVLGLRALLNVDNEANIPSLFSSLLLLGAGLLLFVVAARSAEANPGHRRYWRALGWIFLFMGVDEATSIHEHLNFVGHVLRRIGVGGMYEGAFAWPWVIPGVIVVLIVTVAFARFVFALPGRTRTLLIASAVVYISGALVLEMVGGLAGAGTGVPGPGLTPAVLVAHVEELLEMLGVTLFIYALLDYSGPVTIRA